MVTMTVYHDEGKGVTTYPPFKDVDSARKYIYHLMQYGCEVEKDRGIVWYPPYRIWKIFLVES